MRRLLTVLILIAAVTAAAAFFAAPVVTFFALRAAAGAHDSAELARLVDHAALRRSLRPQLTGRAAAAAPAPSFLEDPIGSVRRTVEQAVSPRDAERGPDVDAYLSPAALLALTCGEGRYAALRTGAPAAGAADAAGRDCPWPSPRYWGVNRVRLAVTDDGGAETVFTVERRGPFDWRLVHVSLPSGPDPAPQAP